MVLEEHLFVFGTLKNTTRLSEMMIQLCTDDNGVWIRPSVCTCLVGKQKL